MSELVLIRHGQTEWSRERRHTGRTDLPLTAEGERQAEALRPLLVGRDIDLVVTSPLRRAVRTAELAGLAGAVTDPDLMEWDYGAYEGVTTADVHGERPDWDLWTDGVPEGDAGHPGEDAQQVGERVDRVLATVSLFLGGDAPDVVLVAHGHVLRVLAARWLGLEPADGALLRLDTGGVGTLGHEHGRPVVTSWNQRGRV